MEGKVAVITGAAKGLGRAFSEALLNKGAKVCLCDIDTKQGKDTENELQQRYSKDRVFFLQCDVSSDTDIENALKAAVERFGHIDILCNNAGIGDEGKWQHMLNINLSAVIHGTLIGLRYMGKEMNKSMGVIINVSSAAGVLPVPFGPVYTASKHGVVGFTRSIGLLSPKLNGVRVNCLCPSFTDTDMLKFGMSTPLQGYLSHKKVAQAAEKMIAAVGIMKPEEVAECFIQLVEDENTSGDIFVVTPNMKKLLRMPMTIPELFDKLSSL